LNRLNYLNLTTHTSPLAYPRPERQGFASNNFIRKEDSVAVALLPPKNLRGIISEGMFLGSSEGVLKNVRGNPGEWAEVPEDALKEARNFINEFLKSK